MGGFEFYNDYRMMKAKIERYVAPDLSGSRSELAIVNTKLDEALDYSKDIKTDYVMISLDRKNS